MTPTVPIIAPAGGCERLACVVPFCRRTFRQDRQLTPWPHGMRVMCGKHWRMADKSQRDLHKRIERLLKRVPDDRARLGINLTEHSWRVWERIAVQATERAAGIA